MAMQLRTRMQWRIVSCDGCKVSSFACAEQEVSTRARLCRISVMEALCTPVGKGAYPASEDAATNMERRASCLCACCTVDTRVLSAVHAGAAEYWHLCAEKEWLQAQHLLVLQNTGETPLLQAAACHFLSGASSQFDSEGNDTEKAASRRALSNRNTQSIKLVNPPACTPPKAMFGSIWAKACQYTSRRAVTACVSLTVELFQHNLCAVIWWPRQACMTATDCSAVSVFAVARVAVQKVAKVAKGHAKRDGL